MVYGNGILAEPARWLNPHEHIAQPQACHEQVSVIHIDRARRLAPVGNHRILHILRNAVELRRVLVRRHAPLGVSHLLRSQEVGVVSAALDEPPHQLVTVFGNVLDRVSRVEHRVQKVDCGCRRVQSDCVAKPRRLGRVVAQDYRNLALGCGCMRHPRVSCRKRRNCLRLLRVRHVPPQLATAHAILRNCLLKGNGHRDDAPVQFGQRNIHCDVQGAEADVALVPHRLRLGRDDRLQDWHIKLLQHADVPVGIRIVAGLQSGMVAHGETLRAYHHIHRCFAVRIHQVLAEYRAIILT